MFHHSADAGIRILNPPCLRVSVVNERSQTASEQALASPPQNLRVLCASVVIFRPLVVVRRSPLLGQQLANRAEQAVDVARAGVALH